MQDEKHSSAVEPDLRTYFASERTTLAWVRTGLAMMGFGFVVARFGLFLRELADTHAPSSHQFRFSLWAGIALVSLGVFLNIYAAVRHVRFTRQFDAGNATRPSILMPVLVAAVLAAMGLLFSMYLIATQ